MTSFHALSGSSSHILEEIRVFVVNGVIFNSMVMTPKIDPAIQESVFCPNKNLDLIA
jgi:hypothetical protein